MFKKFGYVFAILIGLFLVSTLAALFIEQPSFNFKVFDINSNEKKVAVIPIYGMITSENGGVDLLNTQITSPAKIKIYIENVKKDNSINGVIFDINSPGGAVVPSQEIAYMIKNLNKTKYAVINDVGASGAYWIASACDKIYASPLSVTGSIGVTSSYIDFSGLFSKYGVNYNSLIAGNLKDMGSPYKNLSGSEREIMQRKLNIIHTIFAADVAGNRNMTIDQIRNLANGEFFLGIEAVQLGLIDILGNKETAIEDMKKQWNASSVSIVEYKEEKSLLSSLAQLSSYYIGQGIGAAIIDKTVYASENVGIRA